MAQHDLAVRDGRDDATHLPDWATQFVILASELRRRGWLDRIEQLLRVARQGGYVGLDIFAVLLALFCWPRPDRRTRALKAFDSACSFCRSQLAAVLDRRKWPGQSAVSRFLAVVPAGSMLLQAGAEMLRMGIGPLASRADAQARDTLGEGWHVLDFDPTVLAIRQRALPEGDDLPEPVRRVCAIAAPGYAGRKRGELQLSVGALQHAGSGLWLQTMAQVGNPTVSIMLAAMLPAARAWLTEARQDVARAVVRADGAAGNIPSLKAFVDQGLHFLTRLAWYPLLELPAVRAHLAEARWVEVPDSGSGPKRQAAELGVWPWQGRLPDDAPEGLAQARLVVTRFASDKKRGAGRVQDDWQYELFGTDLDARAWPAAELAQLYFSRASLENRFAQGMAELGLDKLFSMSLGGHWLVVLIGLFVWNLRTILGAERAALPVQDAPQVPRQETVVTAPPPQPTSSEPAPVPPETAQPAQAPAPGSLLARLAGRNWRKIEARHPGWKWQPQCGLLCPAGLVVPPHKLRDRALIFRTRERDCLQCPQRQQCFGDVKPNRLEREVAVSVSDLGITRAEVTAGRHALPRPVSPIPTSAPAWAPPAHVQAGPWQAQPPLLVPSVLRAGLIQAVLGATARILLQGDEPPPRKPAGLASSAGHRQHRRLTWKQRLALNALSEQARVEVRLSVRDPWLIERRMGTQPPVFA